MHFIDPSLLPPIISGLSGMATAVVAGLIGKRFANTKALQEKLKLAQADILYLLKVEELHCELHRKTGGESNKLRIRRQADSDGVEWSGQFTPGRVRYQSNSHGTGLFGFLRRQKDAARSDDAQVAAAAKANKGSAVSS